MFGYLNVSFLFSRARALLEGSYFKPILVRSSEFIFPHFGHLLASKLFQRQPQDWQTYNGIPLNTFRVIDKPLLLWHMAEMCASFYLYLHDWTLATKLKQIFPVNHPAATPTANINRNHFLCLLWFIDFHEWRCFWQGDGQGDTRVEAMATT